MSHAPSRSNVVCWAEALRESSAVCCGQAPALCSGHSALAVLGEGAKFISMSSQRVPSMAVECGNAYAASRVVLSLAGVRAATACCRLWSRLWKVAPGLSWLSFGACAGARREGDDGVHGRQGGQTGGLRARYGTQLDIRALSLDSSAWLPCLQEPTAKHC